FAGARHRPVPTRTRDARIPGAWIPRAARHVGSVARIRGNPSTRTALLQDARMMRETTFTSAAAPPEAFRDEACLLLVDDRTENLDVLEALLERPGLRLLKAMSGRDALELLLEHEVALALVDVRMPEMDGFELAELMRGTDRTRTVPIIFVTASTPE